MASTKEMESAYKAGYSARIRKLDKKTCLFSVAELNLRCQWMAGWNDRDIEESQ